MKAYWAAKKKGFNEANTESIEENGQKRHSGF